MNVFDVTINDINVNDYVHIESLTEFTQRAEGADLWDFRVDSIPIILDMGILSLLGYSIDTFRDMLYLKAEIKYYNRVVLSGHVGEVRFNYGAEQLELEFFSVGKIVANIELDRFLGTGYPMELDIFFDRLAHEINIKLSQADFWFRIDKIPDIDLGDFRYLRSIVAEEIQLPSVTIGSIIGDLTFNKWAGIYKEIGSIEAIYYMPSLIPVNLGGSTEVGIIYQINHLGEFVSYEVVTSGVGFWTYFNNYYVMVDEWWDQGLIDLIARQLIIPKGQPIPFRGRAHASYYIYLAFVEYNGSHYYKISNVEEDLINYNYENAVRVGDVMKDVAVLTNSVIRIENDLKFHVQHRQTTPDLTIDPVNELRAEVVDRYEKKFSVPENYFLADVTKEDIENYYKDYFTGRFVRYNVVIDRDEIDLSDMPFITRTLKVGGLNKSVICGIIKAVKFREFGIEFETEKRVE